MLQLRPYRHGGQSGAAQNLGIGLNRQLAEHDVPDDLNALSGHQGCYNIGVGAQLIDEPGFAFSFEGETVDVSDGIVVCGRLFAN